SLDDRYGSRRINRSEEFLRIISLGRESHWRRTRRHIRLCRTNPPTRWQSRHHQPHKTMIFPLATRNSPEEPLAIESRRRVAPGLDEGIQLLKAATAELKKTAASKA